MSIETTAGVVPDNGSIPSAILLGKALHRQLGIYYRPDGSLQFLEANDEQPIFVPVDSTRVFEVSCNNDDFPAELTALRNRFPVLFQLPDCQSTPTIDYGLKHSIDTGETSPIHIPSRTYSPAQISALNHFTAKALRDGLIRESSSPWSSPDGRP